MNYLSVFDIYNLFQELCLGQRWCPSLLLNSFDKPKPAMEERVCLGYPSISQSTTEGSQARNLEAGTGAEATEDGCLLDCFPSLLSLLSYHPRATCPGMAAPTAVWDFSGQLLITQMPQ